MSTVAHAVASRMLLSTKAPSRLNGAKNAPWRIVPARRAKSTSPPPVKIAMIARMNTPRRGSTAKACTDVSTPERTRNVPSRESEKVRIASRMVQTLRESRFSITSAECSSAVPASQGMKDAFSTGSQNHQPPQPSS